MSNKIGRFEILSEIAKSAHGSVYKATDTESGQTVALKVIQLDMLGDLAAQVVQSVLEEADSTKDLNSHNIALLYGAGEIENLFCAALEYVQGNSIATMLARKEGFSIWDLQDIARQACQGLDHAHVHKVVHYSLEPAKIMVQWDGTVKILGFGVSMMGAHAAQAAGVAPEVLHYMPPEQLHGDPLDARSNIFSLGSILYEMVTERKAFSGDDADQVRQSILEMTPVAPDQINRKIHPALSEVIMKALAKSPDERYQSGQDLVQDLERCKESATKAAAKKAAPAQGLNVPQKPAPVAAVPPKPEPAKPETPVMRPTAPARETKPAVAPPPAVETPSFEVKPPVTEERPARDWKAAAAAAAAGWDGAATARTPVVEKAPAPPHEPEPEGISFTEQPTMSAAMVEPEVEVEAPKIKVDPMMSEAGMTGGGSRSFSEIDELPPLKEAYVAPPPPPEPEPEPMEESSPKATLFIAKEEPEKPRIQPKEVAKKAVTEIKKTPPKLFMYSIAAAVTLILLVIVGIAFHIHNENADDDSGPVQAPAPVATEAARQPAPAPAAAAPAPVVVPEPVEKEPPAVSIKPKLNSKKRTPVKPVPVAPNVVPGQLTVNTTPEGAQINVDGQNDSSWVTPFNLTGLTPGQHNVTVSKPGYATETRAIEVGSGSKSFLVVQMAQLAAQVSVTSDPAGAEIIVDGKDTAHMTPAQIAVDKPGTHTILVRKSGYMDESTSANLQAGQTFHFAPALKALGSTDEIKTVSKWKKAFGGGDTSGMGVVSIKTSPKGAQITVNRRVLDKASPVDFYLNPGNYMIDITMPGYKDVHRVVNVDKGGKVAIEENLERE